MWNPTAKGRETHSLDPAFSTFGMLFHFLRIFAQLLHPVGIRNMSPLFDPWTGQHAFLPCLQMREIIDVDTCPECSGDPSPVCDIWANTNSILVKGKQCGDIGFGIWTYRRWYIYLRRDIRRWMSWDGHLGLGRVVESRSGSGSHRTRYALVRIGWNGWPALALVRHQH